MNCRRPAALILALLCAGCAAPSGTRPAPSEFRLDQFAKTDIDVVAEIHRAEAFAHLRVLAEKLYRRNPREYRKAGLDSVEAALARLFENPGTREYPDLNGKRGADSIHLAFREDYQGDRVLAFAAGLATMIEAAYNDKREFFLLDELDPQKLYNSARNVEIAVWKLSTARSAGGELLLLSNEADATVRNLSFERVFGKLIAQQDTLARIIAERTNRTIVRAVQSLATAVFLPI